MDEAEIAPKISAKVADAPVSNQQNLILPPQSRAAEAKLYFHRWLPPQNPRAIILFAHGYAEHGGRYANLAAPFIRAGYGFYALDHWGHGQSSGKGGFVPHFSVFTDGLEALRAYIGDEFPTIPVLLIGHSMGGLIAARHLLHHSSRYAAAALSGPALAPAKNPSALLRGISKLLSRFAPKLGVMALDSKAISRTSSIVQAYQADPLVYKGKVSARLADELLRAMGEAMAGAPSLHLPIFIQHGSADRLTSPVASENFFRQLGSAAKSIKIYDGLFHEIYNEPEKNEVIYDLISWCDDQLIKAG